ncbi:MAG: OB-fold domain-containing protein, partial [Acidobacteriota bacterium]
MIGRLDGRLHRVDPGTVLIDVGGVGYLVSITLRAFQDLAGRETAALWIHTQVRDDSIVLFGFPER